MSYLAKVLKSGDITDVHITYSPMDAGYWASAAFNERWDFAKLDHFADVLEDAIEGLSADVRVTFISELRMLEQDQAMRIDSLRTVVNL